MEEKPVYPIDYLQCIPNMELVTNTSSDIMLCTNFKDSNKTCPEDDFPFPDIKIIVDLTTGNELLSLMEKFSRYNQIWIEKEDQ